MSKVATTICGNKNGQDFFLIDNREILVSSLVIENIRKCFPKENLTRPLRTISKVFRNVYNAPSKIPLKILLTDGTNDTGTYYFSIDGLQIVFLVYQSSIIHVENIDEIGYYSYSQKIWDLANNRFLDEYIVSDENIGEVEREGDLGIVSDIDKLLGCPINPNRFIREPKNLKVEFVPPPPKNPDIMHPSNRVFKCKYTRTISLSKHALCRFIERFPSNSIASPIELLKTIFDNSIEILLSEKHQKLRLKKHGLQARYLYHQEGWMFVCSFEKKRITILTIERREGWKEGFEYTKRFLEESVDKEESI